MNATSFVNGREPAAGRLPSPDRDFLCRATLAAVLVLMAHRFQWQSLRFLTSEVILRFSALLGMSTARLSVDTIRVNSAAFQFVTACTFVDVVAGAMPFLWDLNKSQLRNIFRLIAAVLLLLSFNLLRLEVGQVVFARGLPWIWADEVLGGFCYFAVWIVLWRSRTWSSSRRDIAFVLDNLVA